MADHYLNIPSYQPIDEDEGLITYEMYFEELQAKSHGLGCTYGRMCYNHPTHPDKALWKERSNYWHDYHRALSYMNSPIETTFKVYQAICSFAAEYALYEELEIKLKTNQL